MELPAEVHEKIVLLSQEGDAFLKAKDFVSAKGKYLSALRLLPENHRDWKAATWLYTSLGDAHFHLKAYEKAFQCYFNAVQCPDGFGNPYIHLRLGQTYFENKDLDKAADELTRAYMGAGMVIFMEDDPKYLEYLETKIDL